jgi:hypothetical protein
MLRFNAVLLSEFLKVIAPGKTSTVGKLNTALSLPAQIICHSA